MRKLIKLGRWQLYKIKMKKIRKIFWKRIKFSLRCHTFPKLIESKLLEERSYLCLQKGDVRNSHCSSYTHDFVSAFFLCSSKSSDTLQFQRGIAAGVYLFKKVLVNIMKSIPLITFLRHPLKHAFKYMHSFSEN